VFRFLVLIALISVFVGCGSVEPTMVVANGDDVRTEIERISPLLSKDKAAKFKTAARVLSMQAGMSSLPLAMADPNGNAEAITHKAMATALNGKTPSQVIADYNKLAPEMRDSLGKMIDRMEAAGPARLPMP
jgi:predicted cupin superfamily sugar epimerase